LTLAASAAMESGAFLSGSSQQSMQQGTGQHEAQESPARECFNPDRSAPQRSSAASSLGPSQGTPARPNAQSAWPGGTYVSVMA
jgi:hypothetical protein